MFSGTALNILSAKSEVYARSVMVLMGRAYEASAPMTLSVTKRLSFLESAATASSKSISKVSCVTGRLFGEVQSTVFSVLEFLTMNVSFGLLPVDSAGVQTASAPVFVTKTFSFVTDL